MSFINKVSTGFKRFVFGDDEREQHDGMIALRTPKSRVKFESDLTKEEDFDRVISLLTNEKKIMFHNDF